MSVWKCDIVDSCTGKALRLDRIEDNGQGGIRLVLARQTRGRRSERAKWPPEYREYSTAGPVGGGKLRWRCPKNHCRVDVLVSWDRLIEVAEKLRDNGVTSIELASLAAILSKQ